MIIGTAKEGKEATCLLMSDIYCSPGYNSFERKRDSNRPDADVWCGELAYDEIFIRLYDLFLGEEFSIICQEELCLVIEALCFGQLCIV